MGGKGGGGGDGGAAAAAAEEKARKERIESNIRAIKGQFFQRADPTPVPGQEMGKVQTGLDYLPGQENWDQSVRQVPVYGTGVINQDEIDRINAQNEARGFTDQPTQSRLNAFQDIEQRVRDRFLPDFEQDIGDAKRELKFALSRRSLGGSTAQLDAEERLRDRIGHGRRGIDQRVAQARSEKEALDQNLLNNLIGQAQSDVSRSSLMGGLGSSFLANANRAVTGANQQAMGNIFQDVGSLFKEINDQRAVQQGLTNAAIFASQMRQNPTNLFSSQKGTSGSITDI